VTERHRTERGRLVIKPLEGAMLPIENGFEWDILQMIVVDENGKRYVGSELAAGAATRLKEISGDQELSDFSALIAQQLPRMPEGAANYNSGYNSGYGRAYRMYGYEAPTFQFAASQMEKTLDSLSRTYQKGSLPPRSYALILRDNPGIEKGVEHPNERAPLHVLIGKY
jgi:hypothetical protein